MTSARARRRCRSKTAAICRWRPATRAAPRPAGRQRHKRRRCRRSYIATRRRRGQRRRRALRGRGWWRSSFAARFHLASENRRRSSSRRIWARRRPPYGSLHRRRPRARAPLGRQRSRSASASAIAAFVCCAAAARVGAAAAAAAALRAQRARQKRVAFRRRGGGAGDSDALGSAFMGHNAEARSSAEMARALRACRARDCRRRHGSAAFVVGARLTPLSVSRPICNLSFRASRSPSARAGLRRRHRLLQRGRPLRGVGFASPAGARPPRRRHQRAKAVTPHASRRRARWTFAAASDGPYESESARARQSSWSSSCSRASSTEALECQLSTALRRLRVVGAARARRASVGEAARARLFACKVQDPPRVTRRSPWRPMSLGECEVPQPLDSPFIMRLASRFQISHTSISWWIGRRRRFARHLIGVAVSRRRVAEIHRPRRPTRRTPTCKVDYLSRSAAAENLVTLAPCIC